MAKILVTGSSQGLGLMAGQLLLQEGHQVVLHARNEQRAEATRAAAPGIEAVIVGDLSTLSATHAVAGQANALGTFDAVIHNAAVGYKEKSRVVTEDGLAQVFAVNTLAPYVLTALMHRPKRLVYISSELHRRGDATLKDLNWETRPWRGNQAYSDTKLHDVLLAFAVAGRWPGVLSNAIEPGWVATRMGGPNASGNLDEGHRTQVWLAVSNDPRAAVTGNYFFHKRLQKVLPAASDREKQDALLAECERLSGVRLPA